MKTICLMVFVMLVYGCTPCGPNEQPVMTDGGEVPDLGVTDASASLGEVCGVESTAGLDDSVWISDPTQARTCAAGLRCADAQCSGPGWACENCDTVCVDAHGAFTAVTLRCAVSAGRQGL